MESKETIGVASFKITIDDSGVKLALNTLNSEVSQSVSGMAQESAKQSNKFSTAWSAANGVIIAATAKAFDKVTSLVTSSISSAISRIDTLNAFPKMMAIFGVSADEAAKSIDRISERMSGLPTSLDQAAAGVQNLFMVTKDLTQAEDLFYAINDAAMVFANGSTAAIDNFIYGYKQSLSMGKVQAEEFNQMNEAIPGLMDKVAETMNLTYGELKSGLSEGSVSIEEFNTALKRLDTEGSDSMASLQESAKSATGGIATVMKNMQTAVSRGVSKVIKAIGEENIQMIIKGIGTALENLGSAIAGVINFIQENEWAGQLILSLLGAIATVITASVIPAILGMTAALLANPITWVVAGITALIFAIVQLITHFNQIKEVVRSVFGWIGDFIGGVVETISSTFESWWELMTGLFGGIGSFFADVFQEAFDRVTGIFSGIGDFFQGIWDTIVGIFTGVGKVVGDAVSGAFKTVVNGVLGFIEGFINGPINLINGFIDGINTVFGAVGINIGRLSGVSLPRMYTGGIVPADGGGTPIIAGDGGEDEFIVPESKMASLMRQLKEDGAGGDTFNFTFNGVLGTPSEMRELAVVFHDKYEEVKKSRFQNA